MCFDLVDSCWKFAEIKTGKLVRQESTRSKEEDLEEKVI